VKYLCTECGRIYRTLAQAKAYCCDRVEGVADDRVTLCPIDGDACNAPGCVHCQGTGLMLKEGVSREP